MDGREEEVIRPDQGLLEKFQNTENPNDGEKDVDCDESTKISVKDNQFVGNYTEKVNGGECNKLITVDDFLPVLVGVWVKMSPEIRHAYRILRELLSDKIKLVVEPFLTAVSSDEYPDYYDVIKEPMDLFKISEKFHSMEYSSITEMVADVRQMIENCYKYNGTDSFISKQAHKLEIILEQKLNLLSRELRSKTTIAATNEIRNRGYLNSLLFTSGGRRISLKRTNGDSSLIAMQMHLKEELEEKERKRLKDKERREMNDALEEECEKWTKEFLNDEVIAELSDTWEIPSVGIFIFILKDFLNLQDLNYSEFEMGLLCPTKSSLVAKIFTSLLVTPFQRRKLNSKEPMKYSVWSEKVQTKILSWYKIASTSGPEYTASLFGFDAELFDVLGYVNPFLDSSFDELSLKSRMWILKALCEAALEQDSAMRDHFGELEFIDRQDLCLGYDSEGYSYHYISQFGTTDIRIYRQKTSAEPEMPRIRDEPVIMEKEPKPVKEETLKAEIKEIEENQKPNVETKENGEIEILKPLVRTSARIRTKRSLSPPNSKVTPPMKEKKKKKKKKLFRDFHVIVNDMQSLKELFDKFDHLVKAKPNKRSPEKELHQTLEALYMELKKREATFIRCNQKARTKVMLECRALEKEEIQPEEALKSETGWESGNDDEEDEEDSKMDDIGTVCNTEDAEMQQPLKDQRLATEPSIVALPNKSIQASPALSKEGRRLRNKRFDVKDLFSEIEQPSRKRPKLETGRQKMQTVDDSRWTRLSLAQSNEEWDAGDFQVNGQGNTEKDSLHFRGQPGSCIGSRRLSANSRSRQMKNVDISENDIQILRNKRLEKIKNDLKEGKLLTPEEERNLTNLGLSVEEIKALKANNFKSENSGNQAKDGKKVPVSGDAANSFFSYDGLKALADIASLAQKETPSSKVDKKKEISVKVVVKQSLDQKIGIHLPQKIATQGNDAGVIVKKNPSNVSNDDSQAKFHRSDYESGRTKFVVVSSSYDDKAKMERKLSADSKVNLSPKSQVIVLTKDSQLMHNAGKAPEKGKRIIIEPSKPKIPTETKDAKAALQGNNCIATNSATAVPMTYQVTTESSPGRDRPLVWQRRRPNILRRPAVVIATSSVANVSSAKELNVSSAMVDASPGKKESVVIVKSQQNQSGIVTTKSLPALPVTSNQMLSSDSNVSIVANDVGIESGMPCSNNQPAAASAKEVNGLYTTQKDILANEARQGIGSTVASVGLTQPAQQQVKSTFPPQANLGALNLPSTSLHLNADKAPTTSVSAPLLIVSQGAQLLKQNGIPLILGKNASDKSQPVLFLTSTQPLLNQGNLQQVNLPQGNLQQQQRVVLQPKGDSCVLAIQQQPPNTANKTHTGASYAGNFVKDTSQMALTKCPVTTLKSKLHAAALKRKLHGKSRIEGAQSYQPIASKMNAPLPLRIENGVANDGGTPLQGKVVYQAQNFDGSQKKIALSRKPRPVNIVRNDSSAPTIAPNIATNIAPKIIQVAAKTNSDSKLSSNPLTINRPFIIGKDQIDNGVSSEAFSVSSPSKIGGLVSIDGNRDAVKGEKEVVLLMSGISGQVGLVPSQPLEKRIMSSTLTETKNVQIVKTVGSVMTSNKNEYLLTTSDGKSAFFSNWTYADSAQKAKITVAKRSLVSAAPPKTTQSYQPIKPAIKLNQDATLVSNSTPVSQVASPIIVAPAGFALQPSYQAAIPLASLPAQIVQLPAQIPAKQVVTGAAESNRGIATASQLVIVPQTRTLKEIRPASDSTTAVKALKSLDQVSKPTLAVNSPIELAVPYIRENKTIASETSSSVMTMPVLQNAVQSIDPNILNHSISSVSSVSSAAVPPSLAAPAQECSELQASTAVKDKSSVTYSIVSPIPSAEVQCPLPGVDAAANKANT